MNSLMDTETLLRLDNLCVAFGENLIINKASLTLRKRDFIVLTGPNGGGKTTLLRIIAGLLIPTAGRIWKKNGLTLGYLPQYRKIDRQFPITIEEVVRSGLQNRQFSTKAEEKQRIADTMELLSIHELAKRNISSLSGGQWQRVLLARAIVAKPDLLLLDEPDTHLDLEGKNFLYKLLEKVNKHSAIVLVSHDHALNIGDVWEVKHTHLHPGTHIA